MLNKWQLMANGNKSIASENSSPIFLFILLSRVVLEESIALTDRVSNEFFSSFTFKVYTLEAANEPS